MPDVHGSQSLSGIATPHHMGNLPRSRQKLLKALNLGGHRNILIACLKTGRGGHVERRRCREVGGFRRSEPQLHIASTGMQRRALGTNAEPVSQQSLLQQLAGTVVPVTAESEPVGPRIIVVGQGNLMPLPTGRYTRAE
ncbi:hypothetical protein E7Z53_18020 [Kocuria salina]|nr:hypothetical protein [Kocuria salina]